MLDFATTASMWLLPSMGAALVILAGAFISLRHQRACPSCRVPMHTLAEPGLGGQGPSYEVMACDRCSNVATLAHGHQARFAYCPACMNRALNIPAMRLPDHEGHAAVRIDEHCDLCGYHHERVIHAPRPQEAPMGQVIPFPAHLAPTPTPPRRRADQG